MSSNLGDAKNGVCRDVMATAVLFFAHHIGINIDEEENLMHIASGYLQDLPDGWELGVPGDDEVNAGIPYFFNIESGDSVWEHPLEKEILERVKNERSRVLNAPKVKVISRRQSLTDKNKILGLSFEEDRKPYDSREVSISASAVKADKIKDFSFETVSAASISLLDYAHETDRTTKKRDSLKGVFDLNVDADAHKTALAAILASNPFELDWDCPRQLRDIVSYLSAPSTIVCDSGCGKGSIVPHTHMASDTRLAILAAASNLQRLQAVKNSSDLPASGIRASVRPSQVDLSSVVLSLLSAEALHPPAVLSVSKAKELCLLFLTTQLLNVVSTAPMGCEAFADKLLNLYLASRERDSASEVPETETIGELSWCDVTRLCLLSACWGLINAIRAAELMAQHCISLTELRAVRLLFFKYDDELNGRMQAGNLQTLLKDMNGDYSALEVSLILRDLDLDSRRCLELGGFIKWWCSSCPSNLLSPGA